MLDPADLANSNFAAALLAGGRSSRMGRDKAGLVLHGRPLWATQLEKLRSLQPAELFISGSRHGPYGAAGAEILEDIVPGLGPLGGLATLLSHMDSPRLLVLAIDLPALPASLLGSFLGEAGGVIPTRAGFFEPLAAVYPREAAPLARAALATPDRSMQKFCREVLAAGLAVARPLSEAELPLFQNLNAPSDLPPE